MLVAQKEPVTLVSYTTASNRVAKVPERSVLVLGFRVRPDY